MKHTGKIWLVALLLLSSTAMAQEVRLTLRDAQEAAWKNNRQIRMATLDETISKDRYRQTQAVFLPQIQVSYTAMSTNNPLNAFGFKLQQEAITPTDFNPDLLNDPSATQNFITKASVQQPLINLDLWYMRQAAYEQAEAMTWKGQRTREYVSLQVEQAYAQLQLAHEAKRVMNETRNTVKAIFKATQDRFQQGYLQKSDVLQVQVQVAAVESRLAEATSHVQNASDYLAMLMGVAPQGIYLVDSASQVNILTPGDVVVPENRADLMAMQSAVKAYDKMLASGKMAYVPKLNAFGEYLINDQEALGFGANSYLVGAQLSWTLFQGLASRNKVAEHKHQRDQATEQWLSQKEQAQLELNKAVRQLEDARLAITLQQTAVEQAAEAFRILENRFHQGLVSTTDWLQAQSLVSQQKLALAQAIFQFNVTGAYLHFLTTTPNK